MKGRPTVLLVEDDPDLTRFADLALRLSGYRAVTAGDGESAVRAAQRTRPDVVVLDLRLPRLDGWQVLAALQRDPELATVPVVILTASADPRDRERARTARIADFVQKPLTADRLLEVVEHALAAPRVAMGT
jgi:two-component system KDP operon response regulator KdpE